MPCFCRFFYLLRILVFVIAYSLFSATILGSKENFIETGYIYVESNESIFIGEYYCIEGILFGSYIRATKVSPGYTKRPYIDEPISIYRAKNVNATIKDIGNHYKIYGMLRIDDNENLLYIILLF